MTSVCSCGRLEYFLKEGKVLIDYSPRFREYSIKLKSGRAIQNIYYCPWCGDELPKSLGDEWFDELEALGFDDPFEQSDSDPNFPKEYLTDEWWKKRMSEKE